MPDEAKGVAKWIKTNNDVQDGLTQNIDALKSEFLLGLMRTHLQLKELDKAKLVSDRITKELSGSKALETATALLKAAK